jgi:hypothetical protein
MLKISFSQQKFVSSLDLNVFITVIKRHLLPHPSKHLTVCLSLGRVSHLNSLLSCKRYSDKGIQEGSTKADSFGSPLPGRVLILLCSSSLSSCRLTTLRKIDVRTVQARNASICSRAIVNLYQLDTSEQQTTVVYGSDAINSECLVTIISITTEIKTTIPAWVPISSANGSLSRFPSPKIDA